MKLITGKLSKVLKTHQVLKGPNYASLPGESVFEPISILQGLVEHAVQSKKQLWILFQNTEKAFDTVNLGMLERALKRIKIPVNLINIIISLFANRRLRVITPMGLSSTIYAGDGIDQGEAISPLLWRIFYDPLLRQIQEQEDMGFTAEISWTPDLSLRDQKKYLKTRVAALAYMDDTTWVGRSQEDLQHILDTAEHYYTANDSRINASKSKLLVFNAPEDERQNGVWTGTDRKQILPVQPTEPIRFLGVYFSQKKQLQTTTDIIKGEIDQVVNVLKRKNNTDIQAYYILNMILRPRIEFRLMNVFLSKSTCQKLSSTYIKYFKHTISSSSTTPNIAPSLPQPYNIPSVQQIQLITHTTTFLNCINDTGPLGIITRIRLKDLQIHTWQLDNFLSNIKNIKTKNNLFGRTLKELAHLDISVTAALNNLFEYKGGKIPIRNILKDDNLYNSCTKSLRNRNLYFMDQLIDPVSKSLLKWPLLNKTVNFTAKGATPRWYKVIKSRLQDPETASEIFDTVSTQNAWTLLKDINTN
jgi:Reverse transcriptase (RNA-dependent DNA polymerase)